MRLVTDADWANDHEDRKSISGFVLFLFGCPVHWGSIKQSVVAQSSTATEFIAVNEGMNHAEWVKLIMDEIFEGRKMPIKLVLQVDNQPTIHRIKNRWVVRVAKVGRYKIPRD